MTATPVRATSAPLDDPATWRAAFAPAAPCTVGLEDEVMVLDADTLDLADAGARLAAAIPGARPELPAAQLELVGTPAASAPEAVAELREMRRRAQATARAGGLDLAAGGVHPFAPREGRLNADPRYARLSAEYGPVARRQLVFGLHVHVCVRGEERALAVYNALREHLPSLAALAANAPIHAGADSGMASVRPEIATLLPRQGVPPVFRSWEQVADTHRHGQVSGTVPDAASWWWETRLHPSWGTIEIRVPDAQTTLVNTEAIAGVAHALTAWLGARHDADDLPAPAETWRIEENRWSAYRHGVHGRMADVRSGAVRDTGEVLLALLDDIELTAADLGASAALRTARALTRRNPADALRTVVAEYGTRAAVAWMVERFGD